jgi:pyruvate dehydrogenase (quinone)
LATLNLVEFSPIDYAKFAGACGGKGYAVTEPTGVKSVMCEVMTEERPTIVEVYVDPFDPAIPPKVELDFVKKMAESFAKGQPSAKRIGSTLS